MKSRPASDVLLALLILVAPRPALALESSILQEAETLLSVGTSLAGSLASYVGGKIVGPVIDKAQGRDKEKTLQQVEARLQIQFDQNTGNRPAIEKQLSVARSELTILQQLVSNKPNPKQITRYREELASDLETIRSTLAEHERRLDAHDRELAEQGKIIEEQGRELDELKTQLGHQAPKSPPPPAFPARPRQSGADLRIAVRGQANIIHLREATHPVSLGDFKISRSGVEAVYFLPPQARAVIEFFAPGNRISIPARLAQRVLILNHGFQYEKLIY